MTSRVLIMLALAGALAAATAGCPEKPGAGGDPAAVTSDLPASGKLKKPAKPADAAASPTPAATQAPAADNPDFPRAALFELYKAEILGSDAERHAARKKHGLEDDTGAAVPPRVVAYEAALKRFATEHADEWSEFTDPIEQARAAKAAGSSDVDKK